MDNDDDNDNDENTPALIGMSWPRLCVPITRLSHLKIGIARYQVSLQCLHYFAFSFSFENTDQKYITVKIICVHVAPQVVFFSYQQKCKMLHVSELFYTTWEVLSQTYWVGSAGGCSKNQKKKKNVFSVTVMVILQSCSVPFCYLKHNLNNTNNATARLTSLKKTSGLKQIGQQAAKLTVLKFSITIHLGGLPSASVTHPPPVAVWWPIADQWAAVCWSMLVRRPATCCARQPIGARQPTFHRCWMAHYCSTAPCCAETYYWTACFFKKNIYIIDMLHIQWMPSHDCWTAAIMWHSWHKTRQQRSRAELLWYWSTNVCAQRGMYNLEF